MLQLTKKGDSWGWKVWSFSLAFLVVVLGMGRCVLKHQGLPQTRKSEFGQIYWKGKLGRKVDRANLISEVWERREVLLEQLG